MMSSLRLLTSLLSTITLLTPLASTQNALSSAKTTIKDVTISCGSGDIVVTISTDGMPFNGMIYPKGLSKNTTCMSEYLDSPPSVEYVLPLRGCSTMNVELEDGVEYFNTIVVQPHRKLVTSLGRGYHVRCKYHTEEKSVLSDFNVGSLGTTPLTATAAVPGTHMHIFTDLSGRTVAEDVKIGDPLTLQIRLDEQSIYGMLVSDCVVTDGLGWTEQPLIDSDGCAVEYDILGDLQYNAEATEASVNFQAHKFPYTDSVYYQCNVRMCLRHAGGCDHVPPVCGEGSIRRRRRSAVMNVTSSFSPSQRDEYDEPLVEVFSGLRVNEGLSLTVQDLQDPTRASVASARDDGLVAGQPATDQLCLSSRLLAIVMAVLGVVFAMATIITLMIVVSRQRMSKTASLARDSITTGSSIYSGPYVNSAYSRSS